MIVFIFCLLAVRVYTAFKGKKKLKVVKNIDYFN